MLATGELDCAGVLERRLPRCGRWFYTLASLDAFAAEHATEAPFATWDCLHSAKAGVKVFGWFASLELFATALLAPPLATARHGYELIRQVCPADFALVCLPWFVCNAVHSNLIGCG